jgi:hypothetical protein
MGVCKGFAIAACICFLNARYYRKYVVGGIRTNEFFSCQVAFATPGCAVYSVRVRLALQNGLQALR